MADRRSDADIQKFIWARENGKLSTRHRKMINDVKLNADEVAETLTQELSDSNFSELELAMKEARTPQIKAILEEEYANIKMLRDSSQIKESPQQIQQQNILNQIGTFMQELWGKK